MLYEGWSRAVRAGPGPDAAKQDVRGVLVRRRKLFLQTKRARKCDQVIHISCFFLLSILERNAKKWNGRIHLGGKTVLSNIFNVLVLFVTVSRDRPVCFFPDPTNLKAKDPETQNNSINNKARKCSAKLVLYSIGFWFGKYFLLIFYLCLLFFLLIY